MSVDMQFVGPETPIERFAPRWAVNHSAAMAASDLPAVIQAARSGDEWAFIRLMDQYGATATRLAQHILRTEDAAADAVQDAMIKAYRAMPRFEEGNFRSWLLRIVTNTCYDHLRRQKRRATVSLDEMVEESGLEVTAEQLQGGEDPESVAVRRESMHLLIEKIDSLPAWHRSVVLLIDVHGYDYAEAAELLGLPLGTVKSRLSRARSALRDELVAAGLAPGWVRH